MVSMKNSMLQRSSSLGSIPVDEYYRGAMTISIRRSSLRCQADQNPYDVESFIKDRRSVRSTTRLRGLYIRRCEMFHARPKISIDTACTTSDRMRCLVSSGVCCTFGCSAVAVPHHW